MRGRRPRYAWFAWLAWNTAPPSAWRGVCGSGHFLHAFVGLGFVSGDAVQEEEYEQVSLDGPYPG